MGETLENIPCNICGSTKTKVFMDMGEYRYRKCRFCGLVYQNPRPVFTDLRRRYSANYFDYEFSNQENFFNLMKLGLQDIGFHELFQNNPHSEDEHNLQYHRPPEDAKSPDAKRFLDIGCATGLLLNHMRHRGWDVRGVEICRESAEYGMQNFGLDIFIGTLSEAAFPDEYFDAVHFSHVIEHVPDPRGLLDEVRRIVKRNGHVIITTPNVNGLQARFSRSRWRSAIPDHIYLFSKKTLGRLLELSGFQVIKQVSWGGIPIGKRPMFIKRPADRLAKLLNVGDVMLFHCIPEKE